MISVKSLSVEIWMSLLESRYIQQEGKYTHKCSILIYSVLTCAQRATPSPTPHMFMCTPCVAQHTKFGDLTTNVKNPFWYAPYAYWSILACTLCHYTIANFSMPTDLVLGYRLG